MMNTADLLKRIEALEQIERAYYQLQADQDVLLKSHSDRGQLVTELADALEHVRVRHTWSS